MSSEEPEEIGMSRDFLKQFPIERERERERDHYFDLSKENTTFIDSQLGPLIE